MGVAALQQTDAEPQGRLACMKPLPASGTAALLDVLSPYLHDELIEEVIPQSRRRGRPPLFGPAQLFRVQLLALLSPVHSFNLLVKLLGENRPWREFARLPNKRSLPDAKMLHQFRDRLQLGQLRQVNQALLSPLLEGLDPQRLAVGILDSTDLPASANDFKKKLPAVLGSPRSGGRAHRQKRAEPVVRWV